MIGEDKHMNKKLSTYVHREAANPPFSYTATGSLAGGLLVAPLLVNCEVLVGMIVLRNLNKLPHAVYRIKNDDAASKDGYHEVEGLEEGSLKSIREACEAIASGVMSSRIGDASKDLKLFSMNKKVIFHASRGVSTIDKGDMKDIVKNAQLSAQLNNQDFHCVSELLLRFAFRLLATTLSHLNEISIWRVDLNQDVQFVSKIESPLIEKKKGIFGKLFGLVGFDSPKKAILEEIEKKAKLVDDDISMLSMSMSMPADPSLESSSISSFQKPPIPIHSGYFISENPKPLVNSESELIVIEKPVDKADDTPFVVSPPYCFDLPKPEPASSSIVIRDIDVNMVFNEIVRRIRGNNRSSKTYFPSFSLTQCYNY